MDITKNLANLRKEHHLTQEQMAEKLQMSKNGYAKLERGESRVTIEHLFKIAQEFNIDASELLKEHKDINFLLGDNNTNYANRYYGETTIQIEKLELIIAHKDELLAQKDKEITLLRQLLDK
ncbi:helix-turn-helix domain-containing protein [Moraxella nasovis]|uniref:helix-turn-helix domain-containing protein n=1 Tax=Moraxella nasovis TaxID=2904121 RepID=UPI001F625897|nr:helix-turn-helix transcriptional regulator [Moraxella nasovis]UNU72726.1 helix-turn-helix domain-containing protein [Moraxella nasovis]